MTILVADSPETKAIRQRMESMRRDLDEDVQEIVESAREMGDWRSYVKAYPWAFLGTAFVAGYLIVPRRRMAVQPDAQTLAELANQSRLLAASEVPPKSTTHGALLALVGNLLIRGVSSYVVQQVGKLVANQTAAPQAATPRRTMNREEPHP